MGSGLIGHGIGLRTQHTERFLEGRPAVEWLELISENYLAPGGRPQAVLEKVRRDFPLALHGVSLSIGESDPLDARYLDQLDALVRRVEPALVSDHLCWGGAGGHRAHDLLPLPFTEEALARVCERVHLVQERLGRPLVLENVSSYLTFTASELTEWEFLTELTRRTGCGLLLDVNNVYVSARNHGFDPDAYLAGIPREAVRQFHLAGHTDHGDYVIDTHEGHVVDAVWALYRRAVQRFGEVPTLIEWDEAVPELEVVLEESARAREEMARALAEPGGDGLRQGGSPKEEASVGASAAGRVPEKGTWVLASAAGQVPELGVASHGASRSPADELPLHELQAAFFARIAQVGEADGRLEAAVRSHGALTPSARLDLYANMYFLRLLEALRSDYPVLAAVMGEDAFDQMAMGYLRHHPSTEASLDRFGAHLEAHLREPEVAVTLERPDLADLAALEWARTEVFTGEDADPVGTDAFAQLAPEGFATARVELIPSLRLLSPAFDVAPVWAAVDAGETAPNVRSSEAALVVWRRGFDVFHAEVSAQEASALELARSGATLEAICGAFADAPEPAAAAFAAIGSWLAEGMVSRVTPDRMGSEP